jgi:NifU-like protein involved in Fe-S cluster formation
MDIIIGCISNTGSTSTVTVVKGSTATVAKKVTVGNESILTNMLYGNIHSLNVRSVCLISNE